MKTLTYRGKVYTQTYGNLLKPLTDDERKELEISIAKFGIKHAVTVNETNDVIDGWNRLEIAVEGDLDCPMQVRLWDKLERDLALELNTARRQMTREDMAEARKARIDRVIEARSQGQSTRTIAKTEGVSQPQVLRDLQAAASGDTPVSPEPQKVTGVDGKAYSAVQTLYCRPCRTKGVKKGCKKCKEINEAIHGKLCRECKKMPRPVKDCPACKEANDQSKPKPVKVPKVRVFAMDEFREHAKELDKLIDGFGRAAGCTHYYHDAKKKLKGLLDHMTEWHKESKA